LRVNALHPIYLGKILLEKLMDRGHRSAVIITSSNNCHMLNPGGASYSSTKAYVSNFWESTFYEVKDKVDVLVFNSGGVKTKIFADTLG
jgi:short-subunit dehydrogenase